MMHPFGVEDLFKRSIFSSIIGFGKKSTKSTGKLNNHEQCEAGHSRSSSSPSYSPCIQASDSSSIINSTLYHGTSLISPPAFDLVVASNGYCRTKQEIYNEIVCECEQIEKMKVGSVGDETEERLTGQHPKQDKLTDVAQPRKVLLDRNASITIEELAELVVKAVKDSGILAHSNSSLFVDSPEYILQKKRLQNNEAAARYRKRQKELKEEAEFELTILAKKNEKLKEQIRHMQSEIDQLKQQVIEHSISSIK